MDATTAVVLRRARLHGCVSNYTSMVDSRTGWVVANGTHRGKLVIRWQGRDHEYLEMPVRSLTCPHCGLIFTR